MHFRKCVALVVREYTALSRNIPVTEVEPHMMVEFIDALDEYADFVQCIYVALCGQECKSKKGTLTVLDWIRHPQRIIATLFDAGIVHNKNLGGDLSIYPMYNLQSTWVVHRTHDRVHSSSVTLEAIRGTLDAYCNPRYPNFNFPKPEKPKQNKRRKPINLELVFEQKLEQQLAISPPSPSHSSPLPSPSHSSSLPGPSHSSPLPEPSHSISPLNRSLSSPDSTLDFPVFKFNDLPPIPSPPPVTRPSSHFAPVPGPSTEGTPLAQTSTASPIIIIINNIIL